MSYGAAMTSCRKPRPSLSSLVSASLGALGGLAGLGAACDWSWRSQRAVSLTWPTVGMQKGKEDREVRRGLSPAGRYSGYNLTN